MHDGSWLGAMGRLYTFNYSEPTGQTPVTEDTDTQDDSAEEDDDSAEGAEARA